MEFRHITPKDYPQLEKYFRKQEYRLCVYSLPSLLAWSNDFYQPYGAETNDTLIVYAKFKESVKREPHLILPISSTRSYSPKELYDLAKSLGISSYRFVPEDYLNQYPKDIIDELFTVTEQPALHDYVYLTEDLAGLKGNKYSKKRNLIKQFSKEYVQHNRVTVEEITKQNASECMEFLEKWCEETNCDIEKDVDLSCERQAVINTLENIDILKSKGLLLRIDNTVCAFGISSRLTDNMGVLQFEKATSRIKGLYQYFDNMCAIRLFQNYTYINKESDMNLPNLAKAKRSYHPVMMIKSYKLTIR